MKAVLGVTFIVLSTHIKKSELPQRNNLIMNMKALEKQEQTNPKVLSREK